MVALNLEKTTFRRPEVRWLVRIATSVLSIVFTTAIALAAFRLHFNLSAMGSLYLLVVVFVALRWGFVQATVVSVAAVVCMNYWFIAPIYEFQIADAENWISAVTFELVALLVSGLSSRLRMHVLQVEIQRARTAKLYELSRAILLIDGQKSTSEQLEALIQSIVQVDSAELSFAYEGGSPLAIREADVEPGSALQTYLKSVNSDDPILRITRRVLKLGAKPIGGMVLRGWECDPLLADAVASLAAVAFERSSSIQKENRAEAERNTERLRTTVLDGLAHGFKTPLTAIQTASSGLLAIDPQLTSTQAELVSIIDEQVTALSLLTTRLLQTAALEAGEVRLRRSKIVIPALLQAVLDDEAEATRASVKMLAAERLIDIEADAQMIRFAFLQLIDNAAKYSVGRPSIEVTVTQDETETKIEVANGGSLIMLEERERIFERFYRGRGAAHGPSGTGLGLSIVKKTAEAHGGRAWVECEEDKTRFFFVIEHYKGAANG